MGVFQRVVLVLSLILASPFSALAADVPANAPLPPTVGLLTGQILTTSGDPLAEGMVHIFRDTSGPPPSQTRYWRVPDLSVRLSKDGRFSLQLPEGIYYLGAIKRLSGRTLGPPQEGDLFFTDADSHGEPKPYTVKGGAILDLGRLARVAPFKASVVEYGKGITSIEGTIVSSDGVPVEKTYAMACFMGAPTGKPVFVSEATGKDGKFRLRVADGGEYILKVRTSFGGPPVAGEIVGAPSDRGQVGVTVETGEKVQGITIEVAKYTGKGIKAPLK